MSVDTTHLRALMVKAGGNANIIPSVDTVEFLKALHAAAPALLDRLDALEKERVLFAEHIVKTGARLDHGCIVCVPDTPPHPSGDFVCTFHHAKAALSALTPTAKETT